MAMLKQYFLVRDEYREKYGEKTILLFQVGAFYEVYTQVDAKTKEIVRKRLKKKRKMKGIRPLKNQRKMKGKGKETAAK